MGNSSPSKWTINGQVIDLMTNMMVPDVRVEAWAKDRQFKVGEAPTNENGEFKIDFDDATLQNISQGNAPQDIYFKVYSSSWELLYNSAGSGGYLNLSIGEHNVTLPLNAIQFAGKPTPTPGGTSPTSGGWPRLEVGYLDIGAPVASPRAPGGSGLGVGAMEEVIDEAMRVVLGQLPRVDDTTSFVAALNKSFTSNEVEGTTVYQLARGRQTGVADLGGRVVGAQASMYTRAKRTLDQALPLLDGLYPLLPEADPQEVDAIRSVVRNALIRVVNELGREQGPRVLQVGALFTQLLGPQPDKLEGQYKKLGQIFGLAGQSASVITPAEEENKLNYGMLGDDLLMLYRSWQKYILEKGNFFGYYLLALQRSLNSVEGSVRAVEGAMDAAGFGQSERETYRIGSQSTPEDQKLTVDDGFTWITGFIQDTDSLIKSTGKRGVEANYLELVQLYTWTWLLVCAPPSGDPKQDLDRELQDALEAANKIDGTVGKIELSDREKLDERICFQRVQREIEDLRRHLGDAVTVAAKL